MYTVTAVFETHRVVTDITNNEEGVVVLVKGSIVERCQVAEDLQSFVNYQSIDLKTSVHAVSILDGGLIMACTPNGIVILSQSMDALAVESFHRLPSSASFCFPNWVCISDVGEVYRLEAERGVFLVTDLKRPVIHAAYAAKSGSVAVLASSTLFILNFHLMSLLNNSISFILIISLCYFKEPPIV
jgi:hypothetical protein